MTSTSPTTRSSAAQGADLTVIDGGGPSALDDRVMHLLSGCRDRSGGSDDPWRQSIGTWTRRRRNENTSRHDPQSRSGPQQRLVELRRWDRQLVDVGDQRLFGRRQPRRTRSRHRHRYRCDLEPEPLRRHRQSGSRNRGLRRRRHPRLQRRRGPGSRPSQWQFHGHRRWRHLLRRLAHPSGLRHQRQRSWRRRSAVSITSARPHRWCVPS